MASWHRILAAAVLLLGTLQGSGCRGCGPRAPAPVLRSGDASAGPGHGDTRSDRGPGRSEGKDTPSTGGDSGTGAPALAPAEDAIDLRVEPEVLRVLRPTEVRLEVTGLPEGAAARQIKWRFDDGSPDGTGRLITHRFGDGLRDHHVTVEVTLVDGRVLRRRRTLPLDRIPPAKDASPARPPQAPPAAMDDPAAVRVVLVGRMQSGPDLKEQISKIFSLDPKIIVLLGDHAPTSAGNAPRSSWEPFWRLLVEPARRRGIWILPVLGERDTEGEGRVHSASFWQEHPPPTELLPGSIFPEAYALRREGIFFAVIRSSPRNSDAEILRLHGVLNQAVADRGRVVLSHLPLAPWTEQDRGKLPKAYRFYEILARYGTTLLASGHYGVTYLGLYGGLKVVGAGQVTGPCDPLPDGLCTPPSVVVLDFLEGRLSRAFAVELGEELKVLPRDRMPARLPDYRRWDPEPD